MKRNEKILFCILSLLNRIVLFFPIHKNRITFVSLESTELESDLKQIHDQLGSAYDIKKVLIAYKKKTLINNFKYMLNTFIQLYYINTSKVVLISDNNYVISNFKREGVTVIQVWHAAGAIKKFGNCLERNYRIQNYDYVLACSPYWIKPYSEAFGVREDQVKVIGLPRIDHLYDVEFKQQAIHSLTKKYSQIINKKVILYAPTFRGNIYKGFRKLDFDYEEIINQLGDDYVILYKYHPLIVDNDTFDNPNIIDVTKEELYELFMISDMLISDYSSIIFDYSILQKKMIFYVPDLKEYQQTVGQFVDYSTMPGAICRTRDNLVYCILNENNKKTDEFSHLYFQYCDQLNTIRITKWIDELMKEAN
ncbi:CDP-glycerol glycerophosphotransferase family protein [Tannockella kyphosi]|uniref:CDP-glycerol glycerophosphotransferase family protein n=1 Tax=Tannockella kyphosi TaxID=2899121 RepID=UPI002011CF61|nr:CDP-glycerol glycerophosphotransferase family protein [Tannockella kyphosi]